MGTSCRFCSSGCSSSLLLCSCAAFFSASALRPTDSCWKFHGTPSTFIKLSAWYGVTLCAQFEPHVCQKWYPPRMNLMPHFCNTFWFSRRGSCKNCGPKWHQLAGITPLKSQLERSLPSLATRRLKSIQQPPRRAQAHSNSSSGLQLMHETRSLSTYRLDVPF